jgi:hypothetical protein
MAVFPPPQTVETVAEVDGFDHMRPMFVVMKNPLKLEVELRVMPFDESIPIEYPVVELDNPPECCGGPQLGVPHG